jgi:hypothetical protein
MNVAYISAFAALAGSVIGALGGIMTTWLTLNAQERSRRAAEAISRRESLHGEFIEEASKLFTDAIGHRLEGASKLVHLYGLTSKLRLFAPEIVVSKAEQVMTPIIKMYGARRRT